MTGDMWLAKFQDCMPYIWGSVYITASQTFIATFYCSKGPVHASQRPKRPTK